MLKIETVEKILSRKNLRIGASYDKQKKKWMWILEEKIKDGVIIDGLYYSNSLTVIYLISTYCFSTEGDAKLACRKFVEDLKNIKGEIDDLTIKLENIRKKYSGE